MYWHSRSGHPVNGTPMTINTVGTCHHTAALSISLILTMGLPYQCLSNLSHSPVNAFDARHEATT